MPTRSLFHRRRLPVLVAAIVVVTVLAACSSTAAILSTVGSSVSGGGPGGNVTNPNPNPNANPAQPKPAPLPGSGPDLYDINEANLLIIKTGTLELQVAGIDAGLAAASQKVASLGGYVSGSQRQGDGNNAGASVTYRIPAARWDEALIALRAAAVKVLSEQSTTQDVTGQVADLGARISNLQATEGALQAIMTKATKIADVLAVQGQLTDVRGQIEELTAQRKHLQESAAFSTLTVTYSLKEQAVAQATRTFDAGSEVDRASARFVAIVQRVETVAIWFGIVWLPFLLVLGVVGTIGFFIARPVIRSRWNSARGLYTRP